MRKNIVIAVLLLGLVGAVSGAILNARRSAARLTQLQAAQAELESMQRTPVATPPADVHSGESQRSSDAADVVGQRPTEADDLRSRVTNLENVIAQREAEILSLKQVAATRTRPEPARPSPQAWLDNLKNDNPKQYEELVKRREDARKAVQNSFAEKAAFFLNRDPSTMTPEEEEQYGHMMDVLDQTWKAAEQMRTDLPHDERRNLMRTVRNNMVALEPMLETERDKEWHALGVRLGYDDKGAQELVHYLNEVVDLTSMRDIYQNMRTGTFGDFRGLRDATNATSWR